MATTDYDFIGTRNEILQRAFRIIGALSTGEVLSAEQISQGVQALNSLVKSWQSKHVFLWSLTPTTINLVAATASYSLSTTDPTIQSIDSAYLRNTSTGEDEPVRVISWRDYQDLHDKTDPGEPRLVAVDGKQTGTVYVWPVPDTAAAAAYDLRLLGIARLKDWESASGSADFPARFQEALTYGLAAALADEYGMPISERQMLFIKADKLFLEAKKGDRETQDYEFVRGAF